VRLVLSDAGWMGFGPVKQTTNAGLHRSAEIGNAVLGPERCLCPQVKKKAKLAVVSQLTAPIVL